MKGFKAHISIGLMLIFCIYYAGISMFSHNHIFNGSSIVHSHLGGEAEHDHSDSQYAVIDILSNFQSEIAPCHFSMCVPFFLLSESCIGYEEYSCLDEDIPVHSLRGPPLA